MLFKSLVRLLVSLLGVVLTAKALRWMIRSLTSLLASNPHGSPDVPQDRSLETEPNPCLPNGEVTTTSLSDTPCPSPCSKGEEKPEEADERQADEGEKQEGEAEEGQASPTRAGVDFSELIEQKQHEWFEGSREWLFEEVRQWLLRSEKRLCWLVGGAGTGKSVASARLLATSGVREHVKAWHFCRHDNAAGSDVRVILQSWAAMLKNNLEGFEEVSLDEEEAKEDDTRASLANGALNAQEMFKQLIADPLARMEGTSSSSSPCVIVLDALDELPLGSVNDVLQLLTEEFAKLPSFVRLFVASRDETLISKKLARFERVKLEVDEIRNRADLRMYLAQVARRHVTLELGIADLETRLEREFNLAPFRLRGELRGLDEAMRRCKDIYAAAVTKLEQPVGEAGAVNNYRAICNHIREFKLNGGELKQSVGDMDQLFADAEEAHEKLKCLLVANKEVDKLLDPGLKSRDSAMRKTTTEYEGDASRLKDLVRFTALFSNCARMRLFVEGLCGGAAIPALPTDRNEESKASSHACSGVEVLALKNKYSNPSVLGHRDLNLTLGVELANGRVHLCELQVNLEDMMAAARLTHFFYEEVRVKVPEVCKRTGIKNVELFKAKLSRMLRSSVLEAAVAELERKAGGLFLYASLLARHLETMEHKVDFAALQGLPSGLSEIYEVNFGRIMLASLPKQLGREPGELKKHEEEQWLAYSRLISLVVAAREPLPVALARELVGVGYEEMEQALSILFPVREGRFQVMHKSVVDWLQDSERKSLFVISKEDIHAAHRSMGQCFYCRCFAQPVSHLAQPSVNDFCVRHVVYHLCMAGLWDQVYAVVSSVEGWLLPRAQMAALGVVLDLELAASFEGSPHRSPIRLMGQALRMDLDEVRRDHRTVPGRLVGRLMGHETKEVQELLDEVRKWPGPPEGWWCPMQPLGSAGGSLLVILQLPDEVQYVRWNPGNPDLLALLSRENKKVYIDDLSSGQRVQTLEGHCDRETSVSWSSDGGRICSCCEDNVVRVWDVSSGECIQTLEGVKVSWSSDESRIHCCINIAVWVNSVSWSSDGSRICCCLDHAVRVWDVSSGECIQTLKHFGQDSMHWSRDGTRICNIDRHTVQVWDVSSGECIKTLEGHSKDVTSVSWSRDDRLCSGSNDETVRVWDVSSGECIQTFEVHSSVLSVSWSSDGRICSGDLDGIVRVWDVSSGACIQALEGHFKGVNSVCWSSDAKKIYSWDRRNKVRVWDVSTSCVNTEAPFDHVNLLSWSSDGRLCTASEGGTMRVLDASSGMCIQTLKGHSDYVYSLSWSSDNMRICSGSFDHTVRVWDVSSGKCVHTLEGHSADVISVAWSSDGSRILSASTDGRVCVWDASSGECVHNLEGHFLVSWSFDERAICSVGNFHGGNDTLRVWDMSSGRCIQTLQGDSNFSESAWSRDSSRICSIHDDDTLRVWEVATGECTHTLKGHSHVVLWGSNDETIFSGSYNTQAVRVWDASSGTCLQTFEGYVLVSTFSLSHPRPIGFARDHRISVCPTDPRLAVAWMEGGGVSCLHQRGSFGATFDIDNAR